jgi:hypothetical protein
LGNIASTVRDVPIALGTPWIYPWGAVSVPALADEYTINWFLKISTISYMDKLIDVLRDYE